MELSRHDTGSGSPPIDPNYFNFVMGHLPPRKTPSNVGDWTLRMVHFGVVSESAWISITKRVGRSTDTLSAVCKDFFQAEPKQVVTERVRVNSRKRATRHEVQRPLLDCPTFKTLNLVAIITF